MIDDYTRKKVYKLQERVQKLEWQIDANYQQIQALKARLAVLEPNDEVDQFMDKINKI